MSALTKIAFAAGITAGYVLGTRAGRERYEQIRRAARAVKENPTVQETAGMVQAQAAGLASTAKDKVSDTLAGTTVGEKISDVTDKVTTRLGHHQEPAGSGSHF